MQRYSMVSTNHDSRSTVNLQAGSLSAQKIRAAQMSQLSGPIKNSTNKNGANVKNS